jgi:hypothetical protein
MLVHIRHAPPRVQCSEHGIVVEHLPWSQGKRPVAIAMMVFLARWARLLLAGDGTKLSHQLGDGVPVGGMVCV